ncbi:hypothetical protein ACHAW6_000343 [Cyclotella cf. meneghiniana]
MLVAKLLFNSIISTPDAKFMTIDIPNFYLMTPLMRPEYLRVKLTDIPAEIIKEYKLRKKVNKNSFVFISDKRHVWLTSSRPACKPTSRKKTWLLPKQASPGPLAPQHAQTTIHLGR